MVAPVLVALALAGAPGLASSSAAPVASEAWYGAPAVVADGASLVAYGLWLVELEGQPPSPVTYATIILGLGGALGGAPINHGLHGRPGRAAGSLALRLGALAIGGAAFITVFNEENCGNESQRCSGAVLVSVLALPLVVTMILDDALLARGPAPTAPAAVAAHLGPWTDGRGARGLAFAARF